MHSLKLNNNVRKTVADIVLNFKNNQQNSYTCCKCCLGSFAYWICYKAYTLWVLLGTLLAFFILFILAIGILLMLYLYS